MINIRYVAFINKVQFFSKKLSLSFGSFMPLLAIIIKTEIKKHF